MRYREVKKVIAIIINNSVIIIKNGIKNASTT